MASCGVTTLDKRWAWVHMTAGAYPNSVHTHVRDGLMEEGGAQCAPLDKSTANCRIRTIPVQPVTGLTQRMCKFTNGVMWIPRLREHTNPQWGLVHMRVPGPQLGDSESVGR